MSNRTLIKLALVEDHTVFRETLEQQLQQQETLEVVGAFGTATAFLEALPNLVLDLVLMDISLPDQKGYQAVAEALAKRPALRVLFLTAHEDTHHYREVLRAGGHGYVPKSASLATLHEAIKVVITGGQYFSPEQLQALAQPPAPEEMPNSPFDQVLEDSLWIRVQDKLVRLRFADILWVEAGGNYSTLVTPTQKRVIVSNLRHTADQLPDSLFLRVHKSYLVNLNHVEQISELHLFIGSQKIPIGRTYRALLLDRIKRV